MCAETPKVGVDFRTGHHWTISANGGEVHDSDCPHWSHGMSPFSTIIIPPDNATFDADTVRRLSESKSAGEEKNDTR